MKSQRIPAGRPDPAAFHEPNGNRKLRKVFRPEDIPDAPDILETSICSTCMHSKTCLFLGAARLPIYQCDEFSDSPAKKDNQ